MIDHTLPPAEEPTADQATGSLVLSRFAGETIMIGDDIAITVCASYKGRTTLRISAPKILPIYRFEIYQRRQQGK